MTIPFYLEANNCMTNIRQHMEQKDGDVLVRLTISKAPTEYKYK